MSDETIQYITTDYLIEVDGEDPTPAPIEYIVELGQVGVQGIPGEKGEPGFSPTVSYILNDDTFKINIVNQDGVTQTPNLYDYFADKNGYLKVDGSNADNPITINNISLRGYTGGAGKISTTGTLQLHGSNTNIYGTSVGIDVKANSIDLGNWSNGKYLEADTTIKYGTSSTKYEIATVNDIGNGTITLTQGGVTKGTFTTNQSGNTTIDLDAGGQSITNPLEIIGEPYGSSNAQQKITIKAGTSSSSLNDIELGLKPTSSMGWLTTSAYLISQIDNPLSISNAAALGRTLSLEYDSNTLGINSDNELYVLNPSVTYTAGTGIDITNDVISVDNTVAMKTDIPSTTYMVTTNTVQTITANKVFDDSGILFYDEINNTNKNGITYNESIGVYVGDTGERLLLQGKDTHPYYNNNSLALSSEIPDVSNFVTTSDLSTTLASYVQSSSLGSAAYTDSTDYATAAQGNKADTAVQPADLATVATTGSYTDLLNKPTIPDTTNLVTLDTSQTITGTKTFSGSGSIVLRKSLIVNNGGKISLVTNNPGIVFGANNLLSVTNIDVRLGYTGRPIKINGQSTRPSYTDANNTTTDLALYSDIPTVPTNISSFNNDSGYITNAALSGYATETWVSNQGYLTSSDISDMATQTWVGQQGYITGITSGDVTTALGYTPYNATNPDGFISGIDSTMVVTALGYTPYNSSNPNGYTSNVGTVTSVNNIQPDSNGNVSVTPTITVIDGGNA